MRDGQHDGLTLLRGGGRHEVMLRIISLIGAAIQPFHCSEFVVAYFYCANGTHDAIVAVGAFVMRGAGCVINDLWDRDIDRMVHVMHAWDDDGTRNVCLM